MTYIVLFRGLNTYGGDNLKLGPLDYGPVYQPWTEALKSRGYEVFCVYGMGYESIDKQVELAEKELQKFFEHHQNQASTVHFLAHSTGGLIARQLLYQSSMRGRVRSLVTIGCPHQGTDIGALTRNWAQSKHWMTSLLKLLRYDLSYRQQIFEQFLPARMETFNRVHGPLIGVDYACLPAQTPPSHFGWPFQISQRILKSDADPSDGLIKTISQLYGKVIGHTYLDHLAQIGFFLQPHPAKKAECKREFQRIFDILDLYWQSL